jgi:hypothetical protein
MKGDFLISSIKELFSDYTIDENDSKSYGITTINKYEHEIFRVYSHDTRGDNWYISFNDFTHSFKVPNDDFIYFINEIKEISDIMVNVHKENDKALDKVNMLIDDKKRKSYFRDKKIDRLL